MARLLVGQLHKVDLGANKQQMRSLSPRTWLEVCELRSKAFLTTNPPPSQYPLSDPVSQRLGVEE